MEINTVTLSLERYHELLEHEKAVLKRKAYVNWAHWSSPTKTIYLNEDSKEYEDLFSENQNNILKITDLECKLNRLNIKKWWQIWK